jgi:glycosyltransferase involved in cell wall biosynthesis
MKVLHIIETLGHGGAEFALVNLLPESQLLGIESTVCVLNKPYDLQMQLQQSGIKVIGLAGLGFFQKRARLIRLCKENKIDIVHSHLTRSLILSGVLSGSFWRVNSLHNLGYAAQPAETFKAKMKKSVATFMARHRVDSHVAVSMAVKKHYQDHYMINKVAVIANPIIVPQLKVMGNDSIVVPGRLVAEKGHLDLLDVIRQLTDDGITYPWVFAGGGVLEAQISDKITQLKLQKTVTITGVLQQSQFFSVISQAQMVVLPSLYEGFGMAAAEAMMLGKAVVVSDAGGLAELVINKKTGLVFSKGDKKNMYDQIVLMLKDSSLRNILAKEAQSFAQSRFSKHAIAQSWKNHYQGLLN